MAKAATDPLLQPLKLRHLVLKNRVFSTAHCPAYVKDGHPQERYRLYHEAKAKGGIGMTMFGGSSNVTTDSPSVFGQIDFSHDSIIPHLQALSDAVHQHGCATMCQLTHMGHRAAWDQGEWVSTIAPSYSREPGHRTWCREMDRHDIERVQKGFVAAARRCKTGGLDGVEVMAAGHLLDQFWNPSINRRTDEYGGSIENRLRFAREVIERVRDEVADDIVVGFRVIVNDLLEDGYREEGEEAVLRLCELGLVDYLNINFSDIGRRAALAEHIPAMWSPIGPNLHRVKEFKDKLSEAGFGHIPVLHACRVAEVASARAAVSEGVVDLIGMTRAHIADPYIMKKVERGEEHKIRPCVGAGYCIDRIYFGKDAFCIQNAATGREKVLPHEVEETTGEKKKVVIVGGGVGGLEAARVCALRGHKVTLFEASAKLGGQVLIAAKATWRRDLIGIVQWLEDRVTEQENVTLRTESLADLDTVLEEEPDIVVLAAGGMPYTDAFGPGSEHVNSTWDVLTGQVKLEEGSRALLYDDLGQHQGPSCAEFLAARGVDVEIVTPEQKLMTDMGNTNYPVHLSNLHKAGVKISTDRQLTAVVRDPETGKLTASLQHEYSYGKEDIPGLDLVVVEHGTQPCLELFDELRPLSLNDGVTCPDAFVEGFPGRDDRIQRVNEDGKFALFNIGDSVSSRNIHASIHDALRLCKDF